MLGVSVRLTGIAAAWLGLAAATAVTQTSPQADYEIGAGDVLKVVVIGQAQMTGDFAVDPEGMVNFPILGKIKASQHTTLELERKVTTLLADGILKRPQVTVSVAEYGSQRVFVTGEVQRPGRYPLKADRTLLALLGDIGTLGQNVGHEVIVVRPPASTDAANGPAAPLRVTDPPEAATSNPGAASDTSASPSEPAPSSPVPGLPFVAPGSTVFRISLLELQSGNPEKNVALQAGDTVYFPKAAQVYVMGSVAPPGTLPIPGRHDRASGAHACGRGDRARLTRPHEGACGSWTARRWRRRSRRPTSSCLRTRSSCLSASSSAQPLRCPLCDSTDIQQSSTVSVLFEGRHYPYRECRRCGSSACDPMPDAEALARMYGPGYSSAAEDAGVEDPKQPERLLTALKRRAPGRFVDFGCGTGSLLRESRRLGWTAVGVEFEAEVVRKVAAETGSTVLHGIDALRSFPTMPADVIHLGDVVEHLTAADGVLRELVNLIAPGGWLVAQGPLEAGPCLYSTTLNVARRLRATRPVEMPPYHVLQATVEGQLALFERVGLRTLDYVVTEVAWPAPSSPSWNVLRQPRSLALYALRKVSQAASALSGGRFGNRYFYIGEPER